MRGELSVSLLCGAAFLVVAVAVTLSLDVHQQNPDEGYNVMKARLLNAGYHMYSDIWSDQPPLLAHILALAHLCFGDSLIVARLCVCGFGAILVLSICFAVAYLEGPVESAALLLVLCASPTLVSLSSAATLAVPAYALAAMAIALNTLDSENRWPVVLFVSSLVMAMAALIKLSALIAIPAALVALAFGRASNGTRPRRLARSMTWLVLTAMIYMLGMLLLGGNVVEISSHHWSSKIAQQFPLAASRGQLLGALSGDLHVCLLAVVAVGFGLVHRGTMIPTVWLATALGVHWFHTPFWHHHYLHVFIPLAWLAGIGCVKMVTGLFAFCTKSGPVALRTCVVALMLVVCLSICLTKVMSIKGRMQSSFSKVFGFNVDRDIVSALKQLTQDGDIVYSDFVGYAILADRLVPPEVAVASRKRIANSGNFDLTLQSACNHFKPKALVLWPPMHGDEFMRFVNDNYVAIAMTNDIGFRLFALSAASKLGRASQRHFPPTEYSNEVPSPGTPHTNLSCEKEH